MLNNQHGSDGPKPNAQNAIPPPIPPARPKARWPAREPGLCAAPNWPVCQPVIAPISIHPLLVSSHTVVTAAAPRERAGSYATGLPQREPSASRAA